MNTNNSVAYDLPQQLSQRRLDSAAGTSAGATYIQTQRDLSPTRANNSQHNYSHSPVPAPTKSLNQQRSLVQDPEDTLEYFIKFPPSQLQPQQQHRSNTDALDAAAGPKTEDFVFVYKETNVPIVMLLGWAGCQDRYLMKYSKIYEDRGLITVRYTAPIETLFWKRTAMVPIGEKILKLIYDMNFESHPVIFHIFSNGGAYLYDHISLAARKHRTPIQIRGMIFDSAPGDRRVMGLYRAISAIYGKDKGKCHCIPAIIITLTLSIMWFVEEAFVAFKSLFVKTPSVLQSNPFNDLKAEPNHCPQLFMYSKGDVVIPYQDVERFIKLRQQQGVDVSSICFDDAEHVKIYTKYPTQYIHCVCSFINNCLSMPYNMASASFASTPTSMASSSKYD